MTSKRVCLLTGASGTLGRAFCRLFADQYDIAAVYRRRTPQRPSQALKLVDPLAPRARLPENDHPVFAIQADLSDDREIERVAELTLARFDRIDLLVNSAVHSHWAPIVESTGLADSAADQFTMNVIVPLKLAATVARKFWRDRDAENVRYQRNIVNVSSTAGVYVYPNSWQSVYSASKAALNFLTFHMANEFAAFGVRVNAIAPNAFPGIVPTDTVVLEIRALDESGENGTLLVLDADGVWRYDPGKAVVKTRQAATAGSGKRGPR